MAISETTYAWCARWRSAAAKEHVSISDTPDTCWFRLDDIGCAGLMCKPGQPARIKGVYIDPAFRGLGYGTMLTEFLMAEARRRGAERMDVYALNPAFYEARGWERVGQNAYGVAHLVWRIVP